MAFPCWRHLESYVYAMITKCNNCVKTETYHRHKRKMKAFQAIDRLEFVTMDILKPLPKTTEKIDMFL